MVEQREITEAAVETIASAAAQEYGQNWGELPASSRDRWRAEVRAANQGGQDDTAVGKATRKALREYQNPQPEPVVAPETVAAKAPVKRK